MQLISSPKSSKVKHVFRYLWLINLLMILVIGIRIKIKHGVIGLPFFFVALSGLLVGYIIGSFLLRNVVDEVWETEDGLLIKNNFEEDFIPWREILKLNYSLYSEIPRINLKLQNKSRFGKTISFFPIGKTPTSKKHIAQKIEEKISSNIPPQVVVEPVPSLVENSSVNQRSGFIEIVMDFIKFIWELIQGFFKLIGYIFNLLMALDFLYEALSIILEIITFLGSLFP